MISHSKFGSLFASATIALLIASTLAAQAQDGVVSSTRGLVVSVSAPASDAGALIHLQNKAGLHLFLKAFLFDSDLITTDR